MSTNANPNEWAGRLFDRLLLVAQAIFLILKEIIVGVVNFTIPVSCFVVGIAICAILYWNLDRYVFRYFGILYLYPLRFSVKLWMAYKMLCIASPFIVWAMARIVIRRNKQARLEETLVSSGLKNAFGKVPQFICEWKLDENTRVMRLSNAGLPKEKFEDQKSYLETSLGVYIDEFRENRRRNTIDIYYGLEPLADIVGIPKGILESSSADQFFVGSNRSQKFVCDLNETPHLLVAGETSSGKSTFLRQVISTLYCSNKGYEFTLIDLKNGLEFQLFDNLPRVDVIPSLDKAHHKLKNLEQEMKNRFGKLAAVNAKDLKSYKAILGEKCDLDRHIIVIDECAELFLSGASMKDAKAIVSKLARQGRACGLHLLIGTQRPDAKALDSQIKSNLPGKICFQMADISSSMVVLGNSKAKNLPSIPGRAIWQKGMANTEIQTPFLAPEEAHALLDQRRKKASQIPTHVSAASESDSTGW